VGLTSIIARLTGHRFLQTSRKKSYWTVMKLGKKKEDYYRQF